MTVPRPPVTSIEAKLIQYHYVNSKLTLFQKQIAKLKPEDMPELKVILLLAGTLFNISDHFFRRSELIQSGNKFNPAQLIHLTGILNPLSWDSLEAIGDSKSGIGSNWNTSLKRNASDLPTPKKSAEMLNLLYALLNNARMVINEKIRMAREQYSEQNNQVFTWISDHKNVSFDEFDLIPTFHYDAVPVLDIGKQDSIKSYYRHNYFDILESLCIFYQNQLDTHRLNYAKLTTTSPMTQQVYYEIYFQLLRISDLFTEIRKVGRWIYYDNTSYFSQFARSNKNLRDIINKMSIDFGGNKQNSMILTIISKYAKRTLSPVNNNKQSLKIQMDELNQQFIIEARKAGKQMWDTLSQYVTLLTQFHNEWTLILENKKEHEYSQEKQREQIKQRVLESRNRQSVLVDQSALRRVASMRLANNSAVSASPRSTSVSSTSRNNSLTRPNELTKKLLEVNKLENKSSSNNKTSTDEKRKLSLTLSSHSPFQKVPSIQSSRSNSRNSSMSSSASSIRDAMIKKKISSSDLSLLEKPKLTSDEITPVASPSRNESPMKTPNEYPHGLKSVATSRQSPSLQRRQSLTGSQLSNNNKTNRNSYIGGSENAYRQVATVSPNDSTQVYNNRGAAELAANRAHAPMLTAQQRLQQHILKSQKNGSMYAKPLENRKPITRPKQESKNNSVRPQSIIENVVLQHNSDSVDTKDLGLELDGLTITPTKHNNPVSEQGSEFPASPLNSITRSSNEAHNALNSVQLSRSRSRSRSNSNALSPVMMKLGVKDTNLSRSRSNSQPMRSRSNSQLQRSRSSSQSSKSTLVGNTLVVEADEPPLLDEDGEVIKKVRFTGINKYTEDEDSHTADRMRKQMRQKWASYKPLFRKLNSQEGETLRQYKEEERMHQRPLAASQFVSNGGSAINEAVSALSNERGRVNMMGAIANEQSTATKRLSRLFGKRG